ncbi:hypothetical protein [Hymenobacter sp. B81]|uniref:hypothetical protein n=1 Tax=Hymenobacter sp. B81 TaxID=3344878 RepID=UPI0037DC4252
MLFCPAFRRLPLLLSVALLGYVPASAQPTASAQAPAAATAAVLPLDSVFAGAPRETLDLPGTPAFRLFDEAFYQNQLFLLGESHGVQRPQEIDFALLRHLNERAGVRYYLAEVDCAKAHYLNAYLGTGDAATLRRVFASWVRQQAQWGNEDFVRKVQRIRALNQTLPAARRIRFVGIDGLQDFALAADYLAELRAGSKRLPAGLNGRLDSVQAALRGAEPQAFAGVALRTQQALGQQERAARRALGTNYGLVQHLLTNAAYARTLPSREAQLFANYQAVLPLLHLESEKLYGMWGTGHVLQSPALGGHVAFAARVRASTLPARDKVVSLLCTYSGSRMMYASAQLPAPFRAAGQAYTAATQFNHDGPLVMLQGIEALKAATQPGSTTLLKLDAPTAAARRLPVQVRYAPGLPAAQQLRFDPALPATAYVQYLLLVRDSGMTEPPR